MDHPEVFGLVADHSGDKGFDKIYTDELRRLPDLLASVDFAALVAEGRLHGLHEASYQTLGRFLLDRGVLARLPEGQGAAAYAERNRIKTLLHPGGMGEAFKVLVQEKRP